MLAGIKEWGGDEVGQHSSRVDPLTAQNVQIGWFLVKPSYHQDDNGFQQTFQHLQQDVLHHSSPFYLFLFKPH